MQHGDGRQWPWLAVAAVVGAALAGAALWATSCTVIVLVRPRGELLIVGIAAAVGGGFALIALSLCLTLRRLGVMGDGSGGSDGADPGGDQHDPSGPHAPSDGPDLWPEFERELRAYLEAHEGTPVAR